MEQLLGRTHREGQVEDDVQVEVPLVCVESWKGLERAVDDAKYILATTGAAQTWVYATTVDWIDTGDVEERALKDYLWRG